MPMTPEQLDAIDESVTRLKADRLPVIAGLREQFPGVVFVRCDAGDMEGTPIRSGDRHQIYLIDRGEMCIQLTDSLEAANGVVVADLD